MRRSREEKTLGCHRPEVFADRFGQLWQVLADSIDQIWMQPAREERRIFWELNLEVSRIVPRDRGVIVPNQRKSMRKLKTSYA